MYQCTDKISIMEERLILDGLIGVSGGRVSVRSVLKELATQLNVKESDENYIYLSYDHPDTELGYIWDSTRFSMEEAKSIVLIGYDEK